MSTKIYVAGPSFNPKQVEVRLRMESILLNMASLLDYELYRPFVDGVKLKSEELNDPKVCEKVFSDNMSHIDDCDIVVANLDTSGVKDQGTNVEIGYAMAKGIPVIAYAEDSKFYEDYKPIVNRFSSICIGETELKMCLCKWDKFERKHELEYSYDPQNKKVLYVADTSKTNHQEFLDRISGMHKIIGFNLVFIDDPMNCTYQSYLDDILSELRYIILNIDDRHQMISWFFGQCYARNIPIITLTDHDYGVNVMMLYALLKHFQKIDDLHEFMENMEKNPNIDMSKLDKSDVSKIKTY